MVIPKHFLLLDIGRLDWVGVSGAPLFFVVNLMCTVLSLFMLRFRFLQILVAGLKVLFIGFGFVFCGVIIIVVSPANMIQWCWSESEFEKLSNRTRVRKEWHAMSQFGTTHHLYCRLCQTILTSNYFYNISFILDRRRKLLNTI